MHFYPTNLFVQKFLSLLLLGVILTGCTKTPETNTNNSQPVNVSGLQLSGDGSNLMTLDFEEGTEEKAITLSNPTDDSFTNFTVTLSDTQFAFKGGSFPGTGGTCNQVLLPKSSCTIVIVSAAAQRSSIVKLKSRNALVLANDSETSIVQILIQYLRNGIANNDVITLRRIRRLFAPIALDQSVVTLRNRSKAIELSARSILNEPLTYIIVTAPQSGKLTGEGANKVYAPNKDFVGNDSFTFKVSNGRQDSNVATVSIEVKSHNIAPVANAQSVTTNEDTQANITLTGSDEDGDALTYEIVANPQHGTLSVGIAGQPTIVYTPNANYNGPDSFTFKANDGAMDSAVATVTITVNPVNDAPVANNQNISTNEDVSKNIILSVSNIDGDLLTYEIVTYPTLGWLSGSGSTRVYTPYQNSNGSDSFTFKANDGTANSNLATVSISITSVNDAPVAANMVVNVVRNLSQNITLSGSDLDGDTLIYTVLTGPTHGSLSSGTTALRTYTPSPGYLGTDSFSYQVSDGQLSSQVSVSIFITDGVASVATGYGNHTCAVLKSGMLKCWGANFAGQFANPNCSTCPAPYQVDLGEGRTAKSVAVSWWNTCAILDNGSVQCWGSNAQGVTSGIVPLGEGRTAKSIQLGLWHACALLDDGSIKCWGNNEFGQLGIGLVGTYPYIFTEPQTVPLGGVIAKSLVSSGDTTYALLTDGSLVGWGPINGVTYRHPQSFGANGRTKMLSLGNTHTCYLFTDLLYPIQCYGANNNGQTGIYNPTNVSMLNFGNNNPTYVSAGGDNSCAILNDGQLFCWGSNQYGNLGLGYFSNGTPIPTQINIGPVKSVSVGYGYTCAVLNNDSLKCWGTNGGGQLGLGDTNPRGAVPGESVNLLPIVPLVP